MCINDFFARKKNVQMGDEMTSHGDDLRSYSNDIIPWVKVILLDKKD